MKRMILFLAMIAMFSCKPSGYVIKGKLDDVKEGKVYIQALVNGDGWVSIDSVNVQGGKFVFKGGPVQKSDFYHYLQVKKDSVDLRQPFFLENGVITISGNAGSGEINVGGTDNNDGLNDYLTSARPINKEMMQILADAEKTWLSEDTTKVGYYTEKFLAIRAEYPKLRESFIQKYKDVEFSLFLYTEMISGASTRATYVDSLIALIPASLKESPFFQKIQKRAEGLRSCDPGTIAQDINLPAPDGTMIALSSLHGKYVLLDFWASWCSPCRAEIPHLKKAYEAYHADGFEVYSVSLDNKRDAWDKALAEENMPWIQVSDLKGMKSLSAKQYSVSGIPATWLLDKDGKIIAKNLRGEELSAKLKEIFGH